MTPEDKNREPRPEEKERTWEPGRLAKWINYKPSHGPFPTIIMALIMPPCTRDVVTFPPI